MHAPLDARLSLPPKEGEITNKKNSYTYPQTLVQKQRPVPVHCQTRRSGSKFTERHMPSLHHTVVVSTKVPAWREATTRS